MAILFMDSFDHYTSAAEKSPNITVQTQGGSTPVTSTTQKRTGPRSLYMGNDRRNGWAWTAPGGYTTSTPWMTFAIYVTAGVSGDQCIAAFTNGITEDTTSEFQVALWLSTGEKLRVHAGGSFHATGTTTVAAGWNHIQFKATINNTTGSYTVILNGQQELTASGIDTQQTANAYVDTWRIGANGNGTGPAQVGQFYYDDWICGDGSGSNNTTYPGDVAVECIFPNGNGNYSQWDGSDGNQVDNYLLVDDPVVSDADYVSTNVTNEIDTYAMGNLVTTSGTVYAAQYYMRAKKDASGTRTVAPALRISAADYTGTGKAMTDSFVGYTEVAETSPASATAWTISELNGLEYGEKVTA